MKTLHFHVGSERCGSTFIQSFFNEPQVKDTLANFSITFDIDIYFALGKLSPITGLDKKTFRPIRDDLFARHKKAPAKAVFTTQELLFGLAHEKGVANRCPAMCEAIEYLADGFDTRIVIVLRRQDTFIESLYNQLLKHGETRDFRDFVGDLPLDNYQWDRVVDTYAGHFGADRVTVVPFEGRVLAGVGCENFIEGVFKAIDLPMKVDISALPIKNPSLPPRALEIQRLANRLLPLAEAETLAKHFVDTMPKNPGEKYELFDPDRRAELLAGYRDSNRRLFSAYLPACDAAYYLG
ncbi:MAG TPA: hypothetical protein VGA19_05840 [Rhodospirillales bacterium]